MKVLDLHDTRVTLDTKDWRILSALVANARQPLSRIAKEAGLSRQSTEYRIAQMEARGLITGYRTVVNVRKLGYVSYHVFLTLRNPTEEAAFAKRAAASPHVNAYITYKGKYAIELAIMAKSPQEFLGRYHELIKGVTVSEEESVMLLDTVKATVLPRQLFSQKHTSAPRVRKEAAYTADSTDLLLLQRIADDAKVPNAQLAKDIGISKDTVAYRIEKLTESNYIMQYRPAINYHPLGLSIQAVLLKIDHRDERAKAFEQYVRERDSILWCAQTFGGFDYIIYILTRDLDEFHTLFNDIKERFGDLLRTYEIIFAYTQLKYSFMSLDAQPSNSTQGAKAAKKAQAAF